MQSNPRSKHCCLQDAVSAGEAPLFQVGQCRPREGGLFLSGVDLA